MAARLHEQNDLAKELHSWAIKEMHFHPVGAHVNAQLPQPQDFGEICKGSMKDIWQFVTANLYSAQSVRKVQGNLLLKRSRISSHGQSYKVHYGTGEHYNQERADLMEKRRALVTEITSTRANIGRLEKDLQQTKAELVEVDDGYEMAALQVRDLQHKEALMKSHSQHIGEEVEKLHEYKLRLNARVCKLKEPVLKFQTSGELFSGKETNTGLESTCTKDVRECCESIGNFLHKLLQGTFGTDKVIIAKNKEVIWQDVQTLLDKHSVSRILLSLSINSQDSALDLRTKTAKINIKEDARSLRFKYEDAGKLSDMSSTPSLLHSIHELLGESQQQQIQGFVETEKCKNTTWKLQSRLQQSETLLKEILHQCFRDDPKAHQLASTLLETEVQIAASHTAVAVLQAQSASLHEKISLALRNREALFSKYQSIQDFKKVADRKQELIRALVKQNLNARSRHETQQVEIKQYIARAFGGQEATTRNLTDQLQGSINKEIDSFATLPLANLMFTMIDCTYKVAVVDLSINRLSSSHNTAGSYVVQKLLQLLEFPAYVAPEELLPHIMTLNKELRKIEASLQTQGFGQDSVDNRPSVLADRMSAICKEVAEHDTRQKDHILPVLQKRLLSITQAFTDCLQTKDAVQLWWEQPAQNKVPWVCVDDKTIQQWRDKWAVLVTRLRQIQIEGANL